MARRRLKPLEVAKIIQLLCVTMTAFSASASPSAYQDYGYSAQPGYYSNLGTSSQSGPLRQGYGTNNNAATVFTSSNLPGAISFDSFSKPTTNNGFSTGNKQQLPGAQTGGKTAMLDFGAIDGGNVVTSNSLQQHTISMGSISAQDRKMSNMLGFFDGNVANKNKQSYQQDSDKQFTNQNGVLVIGNGASEWGSIPLVPQGDLSNLGRFSTKPSSTSLSTYNDVTKNIQLVSTKTSAYSKQWSDPLWNKQWYLHDYRTTDMPVMDLNVVPVWKQKISGKGIIVGVMDDGVDKGHPDLQENYLHSESRDFVNAEDGAQPDVDLKSVDRRLQKHGTMCAGAIAMVAGNNYGGVGVAYNAKIIGIKVIGNKVNSLIEAYGLIHKWDKVDIYSLSFGPADTGKSMYKIDRLISMAFTKGVVMGRHRKGAVYVIASGNGGNKYDTCGTDYFVNNVNTIIVASASQNGKKTYYGERCSGIFCTTYSGGAGFEEKVVSTEPKGGSTTQFTGTSAATPLASGIIALVLEANDQLTYRDVMHIITMGAEVAPLADNGDIWYRNAKGFWVSNNFGFGLLNAENMVDLARKWVKVPQLTSCTAKVTLDPPQEFAVGRLAEISFDANACYDLPQNKVEYLEAVVLTSNIKCSYRGALVIHLTSPQGTRSQLLEVRVKDDNKNGLEDWGIKCVHFWGENPKGTWKLEVRATAVGGRDVSGVVENFSLTFYGTATAPAYHNMRTVAFPRKYSGFRLANGKTSEDPL